MRTVDSPQLGLPFDFETLHTWTDTIISAEAGPAGRQLELELSVHLTATGARLRLVGPWPAEEAGAPGRPDAPAPRGVLWRAEVDLRRPWRSTVSPPPEGGHHFSFATTHPFPELFTAPLAWAAEAGRWWKVPVEDLLMTMRRSLVLLDRHLERIRIPARRRGSASLRRGSATGPRRAVATAS
jgi:hypothetical protein